jgi:hypothetical protein
MDLWVITRFFRILICRLLKPLDSKLALAGLITVELPSVRVTLLFRRAFIELMDQKGWELQDIIMERAMVYTSHGHKLRFSAACFAGLTHVEIPCPLSV